MFRITIVLAAALLACANGFSPASAQTYPQRAVKIGRAHV